MRICNICETPKDESEFYGNNRTRDKLMLRCKVCQSKAVMASQKKKPEYYTKEYKMKSHDRRRFNVYGLTQVEYTRMLKEQNGLCKICSNPPVKRSLHIDHNHETGKVRGLLCHNCNVGLGHFRSSLALLYQAVNYIKTTDM